MSKPGPDTKADPLIPAEDSGQYLIPALTAQELAVTPEAWPMLRHLFREEARDRGLHVELWTNHETGDVAVVWRKAKSGEAFLA